MMNTKRILSVSSNSNSNDLTNNDDDSICLFRFLRQQQEQQQSVKVSKPTIPVAHKARRNNNIDSFITSRSRQKSSLDAKRKDRKLGNDITANATAKLVRMIGLDEAKHISSNNIVNRIRIKINSTFLSRKQFITKELQSLTRNQRRILIMALLLGIIIIGSKFRQEQRHCDDTDSSSYSPKYFNHVSDIPSHYFQSKMILTGRATSITDGDTFRFQHMNTIIPVQSRNNQNNRWLNLWIPPSPLLSTKSTLPIRLCTIDAPEIGKYNSNHRGQPFAIEAKQKLQQLLLGRYNQQVHIRLLRKDQYNRIIAEVWTTTTTKSNSLQNSEKSSSSNIVTYCDEELLKDGLAEVYDGGGAVYGHKGKQYYIKLQASARQKKIGIWSLQQQNFESASDYKKRIKKMR